VNLQLTAVLCSASLLASSASFAGLTSIFAISAASATFLVNEALSCEEVAHESPLAHHPLGHWPNYTYHSREEALYAVVLEKHIPCKKLGKDAPEGPHVDLVVVAAPQDHLWRAVRTRLHIGRKMVMDKARAAEVDNLDLRPRVGLDKNVFGLEVAVNQPQTVNKVERCEYLLGDLL
jgi:hypothetical protein